MRPASGTTRIANGPSKLWLWSGTTGARGGKGGAVVQRERTKVSKVRTDPFGRGGRQGRPVELRIAAGPVCGRESACFERAVGERCLACDLSKLARNGNPGENLSVIGLNHL